MRQLEAVLGVDLFGGPRSKPELTPTGQSLAPVLTAALDQIDHAVRCPFSPSAAAHALPWANFGGTRFFLNKPLSVYNIHHSSSSG
ncbi:hypothetical protein, partial [Salmonella enterica]|uniref:hypothetical protein n=1 Tax=Salmonella enterica TaxID=28901 RepID=UPI00352B5CBE